MENKYLKGKLILAVACWLSIGCVEPPLLNSGEWIDLTYDFSAETIYWPNSNPFKLDTVSAGITDKGYYYSAFEFCTAEHGGTHLDAPLHFAREGHATNEIPLSRLIGPAVKIDVSDKVMRNRDYQIAVKDLIDWESRHGKIPEGSILLLQTGFGRYWPDELKYLGTLKKGEAGVAGLHFPGLHPDAARWLVKNRKIKAIGIDTASIDFGQSKTFDSHVSLMRQNIPAFENVAHLDQVPVKGAHIIALPMKIKGGSGGPLRIVAFIPE